MFWKLNFLILDPTTVNYFRLLPILALNSEVENNFLTSNFYNKGKKLFVNKTDSSSTNKVKFFNAGKSIPWNDYLSLALKLSRYKELLKQLMFNWFKFERRLKSIKLGK